MSEKYYVYFDSGTTNSRGYLLDSALRTLAAEKAAVGSKDSAIAHSNAVLIDGLWGIYERLLSARGLTDGDVSEVFASGMVTCPYGLCEVPHLTIPVSAERFAAGLHPFFEERRFHRAIFLIPGMKTVSGDFALVNNVRGEEIEILGLLDALTALVGDRDAAVVMPGSHTHIIHTRGSDILGILSNFTGELFYALRSATIMSPELDARVPDLDPEMIKYGVRNLKKYGFNRALYIGHAMRMFEEGDERSRLSYCEGVIFGGVSQSLDEYCRSFWKGCSTAVIAAEPAVTGLYRAVLSECETIDQVLEIPLSPSRSYALEGFRKLMAARRAENFGN